MEAIYILEPGTYLRLSGETLRIMREKEVVKEIPVAGLERLTLLGRATMSGAVLDFLIEKGVDTVFLTQTGRFRARLLLDGKGHVKLRQLQYKRLFDEDFRLKTARLIVAKKIENQMAFLLKRSYKQGEESVRVMCLRINAMSKRLALADDIEAVRGIEGGASRIFYDAYGLLIKNSAFEFNGRNKHPPLDPVNALLSFVYTLFTNEVLSAIQASGLDPYLGALHEPLHGRPSLACDLVEEWRGLAESFVLTLINRKAVSVDDFIKTGKKERPIEMTPSLLKTLVHAHEKKMNTSIKKGASSLKLRWAIHERVRDFKRYLENPDIGF